MHRHYFIVYIHCWSVVPITAALTQNPQNFLVELYYKMLIISTGGGGCGCVIALVADGFKGAPPCKSESSTSIVALESRELLRILTCMLAGSDWIAGLEKAGTPLSPGLFASQKCGCLGPVNGVLGISTRKEEHMHNAVESESVNSQAYLSWPTS